MECKFCGAALPEHANFCPACGQPAASAIASVDTLQESELIPAQTKIEDTPEQFPESPAQTTEQVQLENDLPPAEEEPVTEPSAIVSDPIPESNRRHLPVLIPVLLMVLMLTIGTFCFFLMPGTSAEQPKVTEPTIGNQNDSDLPIPPGKGENPPAQEGSSFRSEDFVPADERCFMWKEDGLHFMPQKYSGGAVLVIPNEIDGRTVTAIAPYGFAGCKDITTIILPDTLETIGDYAFTECTDLRGIWFPDAMRTIGEGAFQNCISLESAAVQSGMTTIGENAFTGCARLFYFFYDGNYEQWIELYNEYVTPYTSVTCLDGDFYHGVQIP